MKKLNEFLVFNHQAFLKDKRLVYKSGRYQDDQYFKGCKVELIIDVDDTVYKDGTKGVNDFESIIVKVPNVDESYLKQFNRRTQCRIEVEKAAAYYPVDKDGKQSRMLALSIAGMVKPIQHKN